jgi:NAD(P)H-dependent FMN reductase
MSLKLNIIIGSTRPGRVSPSIGEWVNKAAIAHGKFEVELVDLAAFTLPLLDEASHPVLQNYQHAHTKRWAASVASADAYVFITPEYDFFPPAATINAVQVLMKEWAYKPAGVVSYGGISGGLRASQELRLLLASVNVHPLPQAVPIPAFPQFIGEDGTFSPNELMANGATLMFDELHKWATALKPLHAG